MAATHTADTARLQDPASPVDAASQVQQAAQQALRLMQAQGFDAAQVSVSSLRRSEVCVAHNEASLLRSTAGYRVQLLGLLDGRRAASEASSIDSGSLQATVQALWASIASAPQDAANAVSAGQHLRHVRGVTTGNDAAHGESADNETLAQTLADLLAWRQRHTPEVMLEDALAGSNRQHGCVLTSGGSELLTDQRWFDVQLFGLAREGLATGRSGGRSSSFNFAGGNADTLQGAPIEQRFGLGAMMQALVRQIDARPMGARFQGAVVLTPPAVASLLGWLLGQLADQALIDGSSLYRNRVGQPVMSAALSLKSRFDAPGVAPLSADGFVAAPVELVTHGRLNLLTPTLYGSRKTGLPHVPLAGQGWDMAAGRQPLAELISAVPRGALVDRLSMGRPSANGDFSGVIKNSFAIEGGQLGHALSETMISGNVAQMLASVQAASSERIDSGAWVLPWLLVPGLHFS
jgi:PmbA protein